VNDEPITFEAGVRAYREVTAAGGDGAATRARVLAAAGARARRRAALRRLAPLAAAAAIAGFSSAAAAWVVAARPWIAPAAAVVAADVAPAGDARVRALSRATRVIPQVAAPLPDILPAARGEWDLYGRAHRAHFVGDAPGRALAAWDAYLAAYPHGVFAPEARYNRALCLLRLGRRADATRALRPFADGRFGGYRRAEAEALLAWAAAR
jgi:hypothetical protein